MKIEFSSSFEKDISKIKDEKILIKVEDAILNIENTSNFTEIPNVKKLRGYSNAYRIRIGNYRLGLFFEHNIIQVARFVKREDIYRKFP